MMSVFSRVARKSGFLSQRSRLLSTSSNNSLLINYNHPYLDIYSTDGNGGANQPFNHKTPVYVDFLRKQSFCFPKEESSLDQLYVSGPCYGLVCAYCDWQLYLLNPATRGIKHFSLDPYEANPHQNHLLGFGFDSKTNEFKIVRSTTYLNPVWKSGLQADLHYIEVLSLNSPQGKSRDLPVLGEIRSLRPSRAGVPTVDGVCYWSAKDPFDVSMKLVSFNFAHEVFDLFTLPPCDYMDYNLHAENCLMDTLNVLPAAIRYDAYSRDKFFEIWVKTKETWAKYMIIGPISDVIKPLGFFNSDGLILLDSDYQLVLYDFITKQLKKLDIKLPKPTSGENPIVQVVNLSEKLVPASHSVMETSQGN